MVRILSTRPSASRAVRIRCFRQWTICGTQTRSVSDTPRRTADMAHGRWHAFDVSKPGTVGHGWHTRRQHVHEKGMLERTVNVLCSCGKCPHNNAEAQSKQRRTLGCSTDVRALSTSRACLYGEGNRVLGSAVHGMPASEQQPGGRGRGGFSEHGCTLNRLEWSPPLSTLPARTGGTTEREFGATKRGVCNTTRRTYH